MHTDIARAYRLEVAGTDTRTSETETTVVCDCVGSNRTFVAGRLDDLDDVLGGIINICILTDCETDSSADDFSFLVHAAAVFRLRPWAYFVDDSFSDVVCDFAFPCGLTYFEDYLMLKIVNVFVVGYHVGHLSLTFKTGDCETVCSQGISQFLTFKIPAHTCLSVGKRLRRDELYENLCELV